PVDKMWNYFNIFTCRFHNYFYIIFDFYFSKNSFYFFIKEINKNTNMLLKFYFTVAASGFPHLAIRSSVEWRFCSVFLLFIFAAKVIENFLTQYSTVAVVLLIPEFYV
ncbi:MAG: hypothetical protein LBF81_07585, partial [Prevotellaceae bacterium]|nr:hypothetical protein [Prevotellaceae bacterium]